MCNIIIPLCSVCIVKRYKTVSKLDEQPCYLDNIHKTDQNLTGENERLDQPVLYMVIPTCVRVKLWSFMQRLR
jgi:hypothetical protein